MANPYGIGIEDFETFGLPSAAVASLNPIRRQKILDATVQMVNGYLGDKVQLPLIPPVDLAITMAVCRIAGWNMLVTVGFNPQNPGDQVARQSYLDAIDWCRDVANGKIRLEVKQSNPASLQPQVVTNERRGYGDDQWGNTDAPIIRGPGNWGG